jgi:hypothetical protein
MIGALRKKVEKKDKLSLLESSLAGLIAPSMFVDEKYKLLEDIKKQYLDLDEKDKYQINSWLNGRYKHFLELLLKYDKNIHNLIDFVNYSFRWGVFGVIAQDVELSFYLVEPIIKREKFSNETISSYAFLTHGTLCFHYFRETKEGRGRVFYFEKALRSLTLSYQTAKNDYLKNRSSYFLTQLYSLNADFKSAVVWYFKSLECSDLVHDQYSMLYAMLLRDIDLDMVGSFNNIGKFFTKEHTKNRYFWIFVKSKISHPRLIDNINRIMHLCSISDEIKIAKWESDIEEFFSTINSYLNVMVENIDGNNTTLLQSLYFSAHLNNRGKAQILFRMAEIQRYNNHDFGRAMLMASESNTLSFDTKRLKFMSSLVLENFSSDIRGLLEQYPYQFQTPSVVLYCSEIDRKVSAWKRFVTRGAFSGRFEEDVEFLEFLNRHSDNESLQQLVKTRLAYLYFKGTAGVSEDAYEQPNLDKAKQYFEEVKENPLVAKHLQHPKLSIYLDMETPSPLGNGKYLFFEKRMSSRLLIIFSCAFSYTHYTQLREFYQRNKINVLFISNPPLNWYHGAEWDRVESIMKKVVFKKFKKENITTYFGSMGGYGAMRVALTYGLKTIVFNPQIDLNLWIKHRPTIATRLKKENLVHIQDFSIFAFEKTPIYITTSSSIEDVEAFKILTNRFSLCKEGLLIVEKIPDNIHAGIFGRVYTGNQQKAIIHISELQDEYFPSKKYEKITHKIPKELANEFWNFLNRSMALRVIIQIRDGEIFAAGVKENFIKKPLLYSLLDEITG